MFDISIVDDEIHHWKLCILVAGYWFYVHKCDNNGSKQN